MECRETELADRLKSYQRVYAQVDLGAIAENAKKLHKNTAERTRLLGVVKAADKLSAYIKCLEELRGGNKEFLNAAEETLAALNAMDLPEVRYFLEQFAAGFGLTLDELT